MFSSMKLGAELVSAAFSRSFERASERMSGGGAEGEGDTDSEVGSRLRAVSTEPDAGLEPNEPEPKPCEGFRASRL